MSKSKKRQRAQRAKRARTAKIIQAGGKSKYAQKRDRAARGNHSPNSPFHVPIASQGSRS